MAAYLIMRREDGKVCQYADGINFYIVWEADGPTALATALAAIEASGVSSAPWADAIVQSANDILLMKGRVIDPDNVQFD